jgi:hypothetical protein
MRFVVALLALMMSAPEPTAQEIRARLNTYLTEYEPRLSELIADERVLQRDELKQGGGPQTRVTRRLLSEVAFIALPAGAGWLGFRRVVGRLWRADVIIRDPRPTVVEFDHIVSVTFSENRALGLLVPSRMREDFFSGADRKAWGEATYTNYRRFQTSARIVPPPH